METKKVEGRARNPVGRPDEGREHGLAPPRPEPTAYQRGLAASAEAAAEAVREGPGASVDLADELVLARTRLLRASKLLGEIELEEGEGWDLLRAEKVTRASLAEWVAFWTDRVRLIAMARAEISPGADVKGEFVVRITVRKLGEPLGRPGRDG